MKHSFFKKLEHSARADFKTFFHRNFFFSFTFLKWVIFLDKLKKFKFEFRVLFFHKNSNPTNVSRRNRVRFPGKNFPILIEQNEWQWVSSRKVFYAKLRKDDNCSLLHLGATDRSCILVSYAACWSTFGLSWRVNSVSGRSSLPITALNRPIVCMSAKLCRPSRKLFRLNTESRQFQLHRW